MKFTRRRALASSGLILPLAGCTDLDDSGDADDEEPDDGEPDDAEPADAVEPPHTESLHAHFDAFASDFAERDGDAVSSWRDAVTGIEATGGSPVVRENAINGHRALEFDDDALSVAADDWESVDQPTTIIVVAELHDHSTDARLIDHDDADSGGNHVSWVDSSWSMYAGRRASGTDNADRQLLTAVFDTTKSELRESGGRTLLDQDGVNVGSQSIDDLCIGAQRGSSDPWTGYIGEILVFDARLSDRQLGDVERHLVDKWDIDYQLIHRADERDPPEPSTHYRNMDHADDLLVWVHHERITTWDISDGLAPVKLGETPLPNEGGCGVRITADGQYAFATDGHPTYLTPANDVRMFDVSDPTNPTEIAVISHEHLRRPHGMALGPDEDVLYVTGWVDYPSDGYLVAIDVTDPHDPEITDTVYVDNAHDVDITSDGEYAFVGCHGEYVYSLDVSDRYDLQILDVLDFTPSGLGYTDIIRGGGGRLTADEQYFLTGAGTDPGYLISVDVSDPTALSVASEASVPHNAPYRLRIADDGRVYTGSGFDWVDVWDASDPTDLDHLSSEHAHMAIEVEIHPDQDVVYGAGIDYDLSDPRSYNLLIFER